MFFSRHITSWIWSSVYFELPPSTITSPGSSSPASSLTVSRVGSPAGTITQTTRGACSVCTSASRLSTSRLPGEWSYPTTSMSARRSRVAMLPPILPSPISPSCTGGPLSVVVGRRPSCATWALPAGRPRSTREPHRHDQVAVAAGAARLRGAVVGALLLDAGEHGGLERAGEVHPRALGVHRRQAVEQERRVEADGQRLAVELDVATLLRLPLVVGAAGPQRHLTRGELAAQRRPPLGHEGHALGGVGEQADRQQRVGGRLRRHDRAVLDELGVQQAGGRLPVLAREAEDPLAGAAGGQRHDDLRSAG